MFFPEKTIAGVFLREKYQDETAKTAHPGAFSENTQPG